MTGAEYITAVMLRTLWGKLDAAFDTELRESGRSVEEYLKARNPAWNLVGRVHFNLAENRKDEEAPFAFLATYTARLSGQARAQHQPLGQALREYAGPANKQRLLSLLLPVQRGGGALPVAAGRWSTPARSITRCAGAPADALRLLHDVPALKHAGVIVRMPALVARQSAAAPDASQDAWAIRSPAGLARRRCSTFGPRSRSRVRPFRRARSGRSSRPPMAWCSCAARWVEIDRERLRADAAKG